MLSRKLVVLGALLTACFGTVLVGCGNEAGVTQPILDEAPVATPSGFTAVASPTGQVTLTWNASSSSQVSGYNVYAYSPSPDRANAYVKLTSSPVAVTYYSSDELLQGGDFRITALNSSGHESAATQWVHLNPYSASDDTPVQH